ncbi:hypothetical protein CFOL_v3_02728 [Cephalotus follicularis]|uniref:HMA domain-containing protein n=1 Tax=Cephalotus follicularis TaxID=3775 RepID=A0A1Q3ATY0_CEPFO|nr:hypothetical protein CFOL_v3_02728 [Cephalotus follicularis]
MLSLHVTSPFILLFSSNGSIQSWTTSTPQFGPRSISTSSLSLFMALANQSEDLPRSGSKNILPVTSLASVESLTMPLVQEVVLLADIRCAMCQKRLDDIMSRFKETESVLVDVLEKKVTLTCRYVKVPTQQVATVYRNPLGKIAMIKRIFRSSCC